MPNWPDLETRSNELSTALDRLREEQESNLLLTETIADLELAIEDRGWAKLGTMDSGDFSPDARKRIADSCRMSLIANPLIIRGMALRRAYIWGQGVSISVDDDEAGQDVNAVVQAFLDHPDNITTFSGAVAREDIENRLATEGEIFYCLPTSPLTGEVIVRLIEPDEITDIVTAPDDRNRVWYFQRTWRERAINSVGQLGKYQERRVWYPALNYAPRGIDRLNMIDGDPVMWHEPIRHVAVNRVGRMTRGIGDIYAARPWAHATKEVIESWVLLFKSLARYAYQHKTRGDKVQKLASQIATTPQPAGSDHVGGSLTTLEAVNKSGAQLDPEGSRVVASFVAAALSVPVTQLLADPGVTGARAVAETLEPSTELIMRARQAVHNEALIDIVGYAINWAVKAAVHPLKLRGSVKFEGTREIVELSGGEGRTIKTDWPDFDSTPVKDKISAIAEAHATGTLPDEVALSEILAALKIPDADKIMDANTDDEGRFIPLETRRGDTQDRFGQTGGQAGQAPPDAEPVVPEGE